MDTFTTGFFSLLSQYGFFDLILPFLLIFSLIYMIVELSGLLKTSNDDPVGRKLSALFSFSFALMSLANQNLIIWLLSFIPNASIAVLAFFLLAMMISLAGKKIPGFARALMAFLVIGIILWLAINALELGNNSSSIAGSLSYAINYLFQSGLLTIIVIFLILLLIISWVVGGGKEKEKEEETGPIVVPYK